jgi:hypothetical protein
MHHAADIVLADDPVNRLRVTDIADDQRRFPNGLTKASREIIKHYDTFAARAQLQYNVTADVAGAPRD